MCISQDNHDHASPRYFTCKSQPHELITHNTHDQSNLSLINKARVMPLVEMLETIKRQYMICKYIRLKNVMKHRGK